MIIISFIVFLIGLFYGAAWYIYVLPLGYSIVNLIFPKSIQCFSDNIINKVYQITLFIRFVFVPLLLIFSHKNNYYNTYITLEDDVLSLSAFIMCVELFFSLLVIQFFLKKKKKFIQSEYIKSDNKLFFLIVSLLCLSVYFIEPSVIENLNFILTLESISGDKIISNGFSVVFSFILITFPLFLISYIRDSKLENKFKFILTLLLLTPFILFMQGSSRLSFLIPLLSWFSVILIVYPNYRRHISYGFYIVVAFLLTSLTLIKSFNSDNDSSVGLDLNSLTLYFNAYFSNIYNVAYGIFTYNNLDYTHKYLFFNDLFQNVAFLNQFVNRDFTSNILFNRTIYGHSLWADQIVPVISQSIFYFGLLGAPILSSILTFCMVYISNKLNNLNKISYIYIYSYMGCWFAASFNMLNISSVIGSFTNYFLPLLILFILGNKFIKSVKL